MSELNPYEAPQSELRVEPAKEPKPPEDYRRAANMLLSVQAVLAVAIGCCLLLGVTPHDWFGRYFRSLLFGNALCSWLLILITFNGPRWRLLIGEVLSLAWSLLMLYWTMT